MGQVIVSISLFLGECTDYDILKKITASYFMKSS